MANNNQMVDTAREDPLVGFHFAVEVQGVVSGYFTEVSGLGSEHEVIEHKVVNEKGVEVVLKIPGRLKWENIVLKREAARAIELEQSLAEEPEREPGTSPFVAAMPELHRTLAALGAVMIDE